MAEASEKFKRLATANGRHVQCRIEVGALTYYDDKLLKFEYTDVTHDEWFTIGTTCANEFSFTVVDYAEHELHTCVRPYISFDGAEWFQLGVFYVARRLFRGRYATFVCYDKMEDLDVPVEGYLHVSISSRADLLLGAVCEQAGITFKGVCESIKTFLPPPSTTLRQIIGYIAALHCACAKFDHNGDLVFKKHEIIPHDTLSADNCMHIRRNITYATISGLRVNNGLETLLYGGHNSLETVELYNPYMTQEILNKVGATLKALRFYGAEVEMQGLPFLESGDFIWLENADGIHAPIIMSEIKYHYDGSLTAKLYSKNKADHDDFVPRSEFEKAVGDIWEKLNSL